MPIKINEENDENLIVVHVSGKLTKADYTEFVPEFERLFRLKGKLNVLFDMTHFSGWDAAAFWEDIKFDFKHFSDIDRLAIVGEEKWQQVMAMFCKPFTKAKIRYFDHANEAEALKWLTDAFPSHPKQLLIL